VPVVRACFETEQDNGVCLLWYRAAALEPRKGTATVKALAAFLADDRDGVRALALQPNAFEWRMDDWARGGGRDPGGHGMPLVELAARGALRSGRLNSSTGLCVTTTFFSASARLASRPAVSWATCKTNGEEDGQDGYSVLCAILCAEYCVPSRS
jgi:hypothetical protein